MNIQAKYPTTADEFLRWNEGREGKREFVKGKVVEMMINVTRNHFLLASRLLVQLANQLGLTDFVVGSADFGVRTKDGVRFPNIVVEKSGGAGNELATDSPLLLAEILSASTMAADFGPKAREYLSIESLSHYLILSQDEVAIWVWSRGDDGAWGEPELHRDLNETIQLASLDVSIDVKALYAGIASSQ